MRMILRLLWQQAKRQPGLTALAMVLHVILAGLWVAEPVYSSFAIDRLLQIKEGMPVDLTMIFGLWAALFVVISVVDGFEKYVSWDVDNRLYIHRREEVYAHALELDVAYHTSQKSGETVKILDEGADHLLDLQRTLFVELGPSLLAALAFLFLSFRIQPLLACILVLSLILYTGIVVVGVKTTAKLQHQVNKIWVEAVGRAYDAATNILSVKANAQERHELRLMEESGKVAHRKQRQVSKRWALIESMNFFMLTRLLLTSIGILLYIRDALTLGELYFFQFSFFRVLTPFEILAGFLPQWNRKTGKVRLAQDILETPIAIAGPPDAVRLPDLRGAISFSGACFGYAAAQKKEEPEHATQTSPAPEQIGDEHETEEESFTPMESVEEEAHEELDRGQEARLRNEEERESGEEATLRAERAKKMRRGRHGGEVLHDINLDILPGERVAFVGHSGAGKTTLAMLLNRFYDVTHGNITVDGVDIRTLDLKWWRSQIGLVLQENIMFNDTLEENIRYARREATTEEVREAARRAAALDFIEALPEKFKTVIGDRGIRLSGGQRQRIAIARAILKNPKVVILDEATSALDSVTERQVQEGIKELIAGRTSCIIAHRLSTVRTVDRIAVFDKGRLIACAPHPELVKTCPLYKEMVELQSHGMLAE
ncbi:MAG: ABC transporter ATP-binding protein [Candidatus Peribacteraceae bacterium]|nr:ABC transporter ATP-binding protein [Candidatus Peribacteraceae bacterium]